MTVKETHLKSYSLTEKGFSNPLSIASCIFHLQNQHIDLPLQQSQTIVVFIQDNKLTPTWWSTMDRYLWCCQNPWPWCHTVHHPEQQQALLSRLLQYRTEKEPCWLATLWVGNPLYASIKHYSPYIVQSQHHACLLTDSKRCVQAHQKFNRGSFSIKSKLTTFISIKNRYQISNSVVLQIHLQISPVVTQPLFWTKHARFADISPNSNSH